MPAPPWPATALDLDAPVGDVEQLQRALAARGFYSSPLNGEYDLPTQQGVQALQKACRGNGFDAGPVHGIFNEQTRTAAVVAFA